MIIKESNFKASGAEAKVGLSLKLNHHKQIKLAQIYEIHCTFRFPPFSKPGIICKSVLKYKK
jgi:hypothetical protein